MFPMQQKLIYYYNCYSNIKTFCEIFIDKKKICFGLKLLGTRRNDTNTLCLYNNFNLMSSEIITFVSNCTIKIIVESIL